MDWRSVKRWLPFMLIGFVLGSSFALHAKGTAASAVFGVMASLVAADVLFAQSSPRRPVSRHEMPRA